VLETKKKKILILLFTESCLYDIFAKMSIGKKIDFSLVIPVFNEAKNLSQLYGELIASCTKFKRTFEIIFVDDGSWDESFVILKKIQKGDSRVKILKLRRNFGQTAALSAGFDYAKGEIIITLDADLQNDPEDIHLLIKKIEEGYDIVSGWRKKRKDKFLTRRLPSAIANRLISLITRVKLHDYGCTLKAFRRDVIKNIRLYGEMHRFIPAIASQMGVSISEVKVNHRARAYGKSKYSVLRFIKVILDLLTVKFLLSYSTSSLLAFNSSPSGSWRKSWPEPTMNLQKKIYTLSGKSSTLIPRKSLPTLDEDPYACPRAFFPTAGHSTE